AALEQFKYGSRNGKPTAIICHATKGYGALSEFLNRHKVTVPDALIEQEIALQAEQRQNRVEEFRRFSAGLDDELQETLGAIARGMHLEGRDLRQSIGPVVLGRVPQRNKHVRYDAALLPKIDMAKEYAASDIVTAAMKVFAKDAAVVSVDSDLASTS